MKKLLLSTLLICSVFFAKAQMIVQVQAPAVISGGYSFGFTQTAWGFPDMSIPANGVLDTLKIANDTLACGALSPGSLTGKIAVVYRGACQFGTKALNAQNAGAVAVIIVNNVGGGATAPGAGTAGGGVTIPVVMLSQADGAILRAQMDMGEDVVAYIGSKTLFFANDIGFYKQNVLRADKGGVLQANSQNATEFSVTPGAWVRNYGNQDQTGITVTADISFGGSSIYSITSNPAIDILSGDSAYVAFTDFSQATYANGEYTLTYTANISGTDDYDSDNTVSSSFLMNDIYFSLAQIDASGSAVNSSGIRIANSSGSFTSCIHYRDANASRRSARGIGFSVSLGSTSLLTLDGELFEVIAYEWRDVFTDVNDANFTDLVEVGKGEHFYSGNVGNVTVFQDFETDFNLVDNQRYLFCVTTYNDSVFTGYDNVVDYSLNEATNNQPTYYFQDNSGWGSFANTLYPAIVLKTGPQIFSGVEENTFDITPFPNPTVDIINIPLSGLEGMADLKVMDLSGKLVLNQQINTQNSNILRVDVTTLPAGMYVFNLMMENGKTSTFNVAVTK